VTPLGGRLLVFTRLEPLDRERPDGVQESVSDPPVYRDQGMSGEREQ
jgi:hypothetical protein